MSSGFSINQFENYCSSDILLIDEIRRMTEGISPDDLHNSSFLHRVCLNENVTLEIVEYLLELYPQIVNFRKGVPEEYIVSAYSLHLACYNKKCPNEVIQLLITKGLKYQLTHMCYMDFDYGETGNDLMEGEYHGGLPLHFYLSRTTNFDINIVKQLVVNPEMLLLTDEDTKCTPIHILMHNISIGDMSDVLRYLVESNPSTLAKKNVFYQTPLDVACSNISITAGIIELLLRACPDSIHQRNNGNALPIHTLCDGRMNEEEETQIYDEVAIDILKLLLEAHPDSVSEVDEDEELPLHIAARFKSQLFVKF